MDHEASEFSLDGLDRKYPRRRDSDSFSIPPWVWVLISTMLMQLFGVFYITGRVMEKLDSVSDRVGRLETQVDRFNQKP